MGGGDEMDLMQLHECTTITNELRDRLRACCIDGRPRHERHIYKALLQLLVSPMRDYSIRTCLQEVLAGLILLSHAGLLDVVALDGTSCQLPWVDPNELLGQLPAPDPNNRLTEYISEAERRHCSACLLRLLLPGFASSGDDRAEVPVTLLLAALYPLLISKNRQVPGEFGQPVAASMSTVAEDLLGQPFLQEKRRLVIVLLNSLVWRAPQGVLAAVKVLVLNDRVPDSELMAASAQLVQLLTHVPPKVLVVSSSQAQAAGPTAAVQAAMVPTDGLRTLCERLVPLFCAVEHEDARAASSAAGLPQFSRPAHYGRLIAPTRHDERLHLTLLLLSNHLLASPPTASPASTYAKLSAVNQHLLGPLFKTVRSAGRAATADTIELSDGHLQALKGLATLIHGATMCSSFSSLLTVWDVACRGYFALYHRCCGRRDGAIMDGRTEQQQQLEESCGALCRWIASLLSAITTNTSELAFSMASACTERALAGEAAVMESCVAVVKRCCVRLRVAFVTFVLERAVAVKAVPSTGAASADADLKEQWLLTLVYHVLELIGDDMSPVMTAAAGADVAAQLIEAVSQLVVLVPQCSGLAASFVLSIPLSAVDAKINVATGQRLATALERLRRHLVSSGGSSSAGAGDASALSHLATLAQEVNRSVDSNRDHQKKAQSSADPSALCRQLQLALNMRLAAPTALHLMQLGDVLDGASVGPLGSWGDALGTCLRVLQETEDTCVAVKAVRCTALLALRRCGGSSDPRANLEVLTRQLLQHLHSLSQGEGSAPSLPSRRELLGLRLLDVLLCISDEDGGDCLTLRGMDECCSLTGGLFGAVESVCHAKQLSDAVRTAALHLCGHLSLDLYPRVLPSRVANLAIDVFRMGRAGMCRAAAASMLAHAVLGVFQRQALQDLADVELEAVRNVATHMASYHSACAADEIHDEVVRQHGRGMLHGLRSIARSALAAEPSSSAAGQQWASHGLNIWAQHKRE